MPSQAKLNELENRLYAARWRVFDRGEGVRSYEAGRWLVGRPDHSGLFELSFIAQPDEEWTMENAYLGMIGERHEAALYFAKGRSWKAELDEFLAKVEELELENTDEYPAECLWDYIDPNGTRPDGP